MDGPLNSNERITSPEMLTVQSSCYLSFSCDLELVLAFLFSLPIFFSSFHKGKKVANSSPPPFRLEIYADEKGLFDSIVRVLEKSLEQREEKGCIFKKKPPLGSGRST